MPKFYVTCDSNVAMDFRILACFQILSNKREMLLVRMTPRCVCACLGKRPSGRLLSGAIVRRLMQLQSTNVI